MRNNNLNGSPGRARTSDPMINSELMTKSFDLVTNYAPAGHQPEAIETLSEGISDGLAAQTLLGVTGSGKTFTVANVIARHQRPAIVLAPNKTLAAQLYGEFRDFFPNNAVEYFVSYYDYYQPEAYVPASDTFIEKDASINEHIEQMRLSATKALFERPDVVIVATVSAIYGLRSSTFIRQTRTARPFASNCSMTRSSPCLTLIR